MTGSPGFGRVGRVNSYFKKNSKRRRFSKKKQKSTRRVNRVTPGHGLCYFFINSARFQPRVGRVPGRPAGPGRVSKHWFVGLALFGLPFDYPEASFQHHLHPRPGYPHRLVAFVVSLDGVQTEHQFYLGRGDDLEDHCPSDDFQLLAQQELPGSLIMLVVFHAGNS